MKKLVIALAVIVVGIASYFLIFATEPLHSHAGEEIVYVCPMHPEETSTEPGRCPICGMFLVKSDEIEQGDKMGGHEEHEPEAAKKARSASEDGEILYTCPMHPTYITDRKGDCPICGMTLVKVGDEETGEEMPEGSFKIDSRKQQLLGISTAAVGFKHLTSTIRTVGRVDYDETRVATVSPRVHGWIEKIHVDYTGKAVRKGEPLLEIYSPELVSTQEEHLLALRNRDALSETAGIAVQSSANSLVEYSKNRLLRWGITEDQIAELEREGRPKETMALVSPIAGHVLKKNVDEGAHVKPGHELYVIADLSTIWVFADIYENELGGVYEGQIATVIPRGSPVTYLGAIEHIYPDTRTLPHHQLLLTQRTDISPHSTLLKRAGCTKPRYLRGKAQ